MGLLFNEDHTAVTGVDDFSISEAIIPQGVKMISNRAFAGCVDLSKVDLPPSLEIIGDFAFRRCHHLKDIDIPSSVVEIGTEAFDDCMNLVSIDFSKKLQRIKEGAFRNCKSLTKLTIPDQVKILQPYLFQGCSSLQSITLPNSLEHIWKYVFEGCTKLTEVKIGNNRLFSTNPDNGILLNLSTEGIPNFIDFCPRNLHGSCHINCSVGPNAFQHCENLQDVYFEIHQDSNMIIEEGAFECCDSLSTVHWKVFTDGESDGNKSVWIFDKAFSACKSLNRILIPEFVNSIFSDAFAKTPLKNIYVQWTEPNNKEFSFGEYMFDKETFASCTLYVPEGTRWEYRHHPAWGKFKNIETYEVLPDDLVM